MFEKPEFVADVVKKFGSQSVVASIDIKKNIWGKEAFIHSKNKILKLYREIIGDLEDIGVGELLINNVDRDGTLAGYDTAL